ncbi:MAG TPA: redox-sensing transcriptional repressor Rex [Candidatus Brocadiia bacterium]|nr:redox-sensing transcriptional repressor Rex [Candidatus Brocadiia bacterium]
MDSDSRTQEPKELDLRHVMVERLMHYYHFIASLSNNTAGDSVTSTQIARLMHIDDSLVRKDLAEIGVRGHSGHGFRCEDVLEAIRRTLGFSKRLRAVIIGAGRLGGALASYGSFQQYGVEICGVFDIAPHKVRLMFGGYQIQPMTSLPIVVKQMGVCIAILTVPPEAAQDAANRALDAGVRGIWNFSNASLEVPEGVVVRNEHMSIGLAELGYRLRRGRMGHDT